MCNSSSHPEGPILGRGFDNGGTLFADYNLMAKLVNSISGITAIMLIVNGVVNIVSGYRPAVFFTLAWVGILAGNVAFRSQ